MSAKNRQGFALIADVVDSTETADLVRGRDRRLQELSLRHRAKGWIKADYTVTAWDEFQTYSWDGAFLPGVVIELRQLFMPWKLRIGVGRGDISGWRSRRPINVALGGQAFERARDALESLTASRSKYRRMTRFRTGDEGLDRLLDLVYGLHDSLVQDTTVRQWETIGPALRGISQDEIAELLNVGPSTVSRNLHRGGYWQMRETADVVASILVRN
ncbi:MAG: SatD family protein [Pseudomonadota bacterium]